MFAASATCAQCGVKAVINDEGELPVGWFAIIEKFASHDPHRRFSETAVQFHRWDCLRSYTLDMAGALTPAPAL